MTARRVRHKKRGSTYEVLGLAEGQISNGKIVQRKHLISSIDTGFRCSKVLAEGDMLTIYRDEASGKLWWRIPGEFEDGRFEDITSAPALEDRT